MFCTSYVLMNTTNNTLDSVGEQQLDKKSSKCYHFLLWNESTNICYIKLILKHDIQFSLLSKTIPRGQFCFFFPIDYKDDAIFDHFTAMFFLNKLKN